MNVLVFGATGQTGSLVVDRALEEGHSVTGFTRQLVSLHGKHQRLCPHVGDVLDPAAVLRAVEGHDAVISVFGVPFDPFHEITVYSTGTRSIVQAMQEQAVQRYLGVTSGGTSTACTAWQQRFLRVVCQARLRSDELCRPAETGGDGDARPVAVDDRPAGSAGQCGRHGKLPCGAGLCGAGSTYHRPGRPRRVPGQSAR